MRKTLPGAGADIAARGPAPGWTASLIALPGLGRSAPRRDPASARRQPLQRLDRIVELEVLHALVEHLLVDLDLAGRGLPSIVNG